jgi:hypothetical protein
MKIFSKISLLALILLTTTKLYANDDLSLKVKDEDQKSIVFVVQDAQEVSLSIYGANEEVIYEQEIHAAKGTSKIYDLRSFPDGDYTFKLQTGLKLTQYQVTIKDAKAIVSEPVITSVFKPVLTKEDGLITLHLGNAIEDVFEVEVLDELNDQLYKDAFTAPSKLTKKFNVSNSDAKELTFIVKSKNQQFIETINLR